MRYSLLVFSCMLFLYPLTMQAQFSKGTRMAGASVGSIFFTTGNIDQTVTSIGSTTGTTSGYGISVNPSLGWFLSDKTAAGFLLAVNPSGNTVSYAENGSTFQKDHSTSMNIGAGGFLRNYFAATGSFLPFGQLSIDAGVSTLNKDGFFYGGSTPNTYKETYDGKSSGGIYGNAQLTLGLTKMMNEYTGLDFYVGYNYSYAKNTLKTTRLRDEGINGSIDTRAENETLSKYTNHRFVIGVGFQIFLK